MASTRGRHHCLFVFLLIAYELSSTLSPLFFPHSFLVTMPHSRSRSTKQKRAASAKRAVASMLLQKRSRSRKGTQRASSKKKKMQTSHIRGRGAYTFPSKTAGSLAQFGNESWGSAAGRAIGRFADEMIPGASEIGARVGGWLHGKIKDWTGFGPYHRQANRDFNQHFRSDRGGPDPTTTELLDGYTPAFSSPAGEHTTTVCHTEDVMLVYSSTAFATTVIPVNPGLTPANGGMYPWLAPIAQQYDKYYVVQQVYAYQPDVTAFSDGGVAAGEVFMTSVSDPARTPMTTEIQVDSHDSSFHALPNKSFYCLCECAPIDNSTPLLDVRTPGISPSDNADLRLSDHGYLQVSTVGQTTAGVRIGKIVVTYRIALVYPSPPQNGATTIDTPTAVFSGGQTITQVPGSRDTPGVSKKGEVSVVVYQTFNDSTPNPANSLGGVTCTPDSSGYGGTITLPAGAPSCYRISLKATSAATGGTITTNNGFIVGGLGAAVSGVLLFPGGVYNVGTDYCVGIGPQSIYQPSGVNPMISSLECIVRSTGGADNTVHINAYSLLNSDTGITYYGNWICIISPFDARLTGPLTSTVVGGKLKASRYDSEIAVLKSQITMMQHQFACSQRVLQSASGVSCSAPPIRTISLCAVCGSPRPCDEHEHVRDIKPARLLNGQVRVTTINELDSESPVLVTK
jgi:hypothetical protein